MPIAFYYRHAYTFTHTAITREMEGEMNSKQAKQVFNAAINAAKANGADADRIAEMELVREYFTNNEFRKALQNHVAQINGL